MRPSSLLSFLCLFPSLASPQSPAPDTQLLYNAYTETFHLSDGSTLVSVESAAIDAMKGSLQRLLASDSDPVAAARALPDDRLLKLLLLAVAGNFTVDQSPSALQQQCGIVIDPGSGALLLRDGGATQSVVLEVLLIVSIVCLLRAWGERRDEA